MKNTQQNQKGALRIARYKSSFLKPTELVARNGKSVYISPEFHANLSRIVFMLGGGKMTISDYLHNLLKNHFEEFGEDIRTIYENMNKPIL